MPRGEVKGISLVGDINGSAASAEGAARAAGGGITAAADANTWMEAASCWAEAASMFLHYDRLATILGSSGKPDGSCAWNRKSWNGCSAA